MANAETPRAQAETFLQEGLNHYDREDHEQALACYQQAVQADPTFALGYNNLGMVLIDIEEYDQAIQALTYAIQLDPNYGEAYSNLGFVLRRLHRDIQAATAYSYFLQLEPDVEEAERIQGWVQQVMEANGLSELPPLTLGEENGQDAGQAQAEAPPTEPPPAAEPAPAKEPPKIKKMAAWEMDDVASVKVDALGHFAGAAPAPAAEAPAAQAPAPEAVAPAAPATASGARTAAKPAAPPPGVDEGMVVALIEQAMNHFAEDRLAEAKASLEQALQVSPGNAEAHCGLGKTLIRLEQMDEGIAELQRAAELEPGDPAPYYVLGFALRSLGREEEAAAAYAKFLGLMPDAVDGEKIRVWVEHVQGSGGASQPASAAAPEPSPADEPTLINPEMQAQAQAASKASAKASSSTLEATESYEDDSVLQQTEAELSETDRQYQKAVQLFHDGNIDEALRSSVKILQADAAHYRSRTLVGRIYLRQKQYPQAIEQLEGALVTAPDYPEAMYFLGQAYEKSGQPDKAMETYRRCVDVAPDSPRAERLRELLASQTEVGVSRPKGQVQCELCLRFFPADDLKDHDGKQTCKSCLALIGGALPDSDPLAAPPKDETRAMPAPVDEIAAPRRGSRGLVLAGLLLLLTAGGLGAAWKFTDLPKLLGIGGAPPKKNDVPPKDGAKKNVPPPPQFDGSKVALTGEPVTSVLPYGRWMYKPKLTGLKDAPKGLKIAYKLAAAPEGMSLDEASGALAWSPKPEKLEDLFDGQRVEVELVVKGTLPAPGAKKAPTEAFALKKKFGLSLQFAYVPGVPQDVGLAEGERVVLAAGDFNGDRRHDVLMAAGRLGKAEMRIFFQTPENPLPTPLILERFRSEHLGQIGGIARADLDGDGFDDILAASRFTGRVYGFVQNEQHVPTPGPVFAAGLGPVAVGAADVDGDQKAEAAVFCGLERKLSVARYEGGSSFGDPASVELPGGGSKGWVLPWRTASSGGFAVVIPLAKRPLVFVPVSGGAPGVPVISAFAESKLIVGAAVIRSDYPKDGKPAPQKIAVLSNELLSELAVFDLVEGRFVAAENESPIGLRAMALSLTSGDWNLDGLDDLAVAYADGVQLFFRRPEGYLPGPQFETGRLEGSACTADLNGDGRPDLLLVSEDYKVRFLFSKVAVAAPKEEEQPEEAADWPYAAEIAKVEFEKTFTHPTFKFSVKVPKGLRPFKESKAPFALELPGPMSQEGFLELFVVPKEGELKEDELLKVADQIYKVHKLSFKEEDKSWGKIGGFRAFRMSGKVNFPEGEPAVGIHYFFDFGKHTTVILLCVVGEKMTPGGMKLEAAARSFEFSGELEAR